MDRAFRVMLRTLVALLLAFGVGLIVYSVRTESPAPPVSQAAARTPSPPPQPAAEPTPPAAEPAPPAPETQAATPAAEQLPAGQEMQSVLEDFHNVIQDPTRQDSYADIRGPRAVYNPALGAWQVLEPVVLAYLAQQQQPEGGVDVTVRNIRLTARRATVDEKNRMLTLSDDVRVEGSDFDISAGQIVYQAGERMLASDSPIELRRHRAEGDERPGPAMSLRGKGFSLDMTLQKVTVRREVEARIFDISPDFLASGEAGAAAPALADVTITADGNMIYDRVARKVTFFDNVRVESADKVLRCDQLTVQFARNEQTKQLELTDVRAAGHAVLGQADQTARGDSLDWQNVTQSGLLSGTPATVDAPQFTITGARIAFYRLNQRFHCDGPGSLLWKAPAALDMAGGGPQPDAVWEASSFRLTGDAPARITWEESMTYDVAAGMAAIQGNATIEQSGNSLTCNQLEATFDARADRVARVVAQGGVAMRDRLTGQAQEMLCERMTWDANGDRIELTAPPGSQVSIRTQREAIIAPHVIFEGASQTLVCPEGGLLTFVADKQADAAHPAEPVQVEWHGRMELRQKPTPTAVFAGGVKARRRRDTIAAEVLRVLMDEKRNPVEMLAEGQVVVDVFSNASGAQPGGGPALPTAALPAVGDVRGEQWRLTCPALVALPGEQLTRCTTPGRLDILDAAQQPTSSVTWRDSMRLDQRERYVRFEGDVHALFPQAEFSGDTVRLDFDEGSRLRNINAEGSIHFAAREPDGWELQSSSAQAVFAGENALKQFIARGDVLIFDQTRRLRADSLQLFFEEPAGPEAQVVSRAVAEQNVLVQYQQAERLEAGGDKLVWDRAADTYVLTGEPYAYVLRGNVKTQNWKVTLDRRTGKMTLPPGAKPLQFTVGGFE